MTRIVVPFESRLRALLRAAPSVRGLAESAARVAPRAAIACTALILSHAAGTTPPTAFALVAPAAAAPVAPQTRADSAAPAQAGAHRAGAFTEVKVGRNDTLDGIFRRLGLDPADLAAIRQLPGIRPRLDLLRPGDTIELTRDDRSLKELSRQVSDTETLRVTRSDAGFSASVERDPVQTRIRTATASITSSLFQAAESARIPEPIALQLAGVFAWDIDFVLDVRQGDRFTAVYEQLYRDGRYLRDGELLAAEFVNHRRVYRAVRWASGTGTVGWYTPDGKPMRKAFLRAPVEFTRVSSAFNPHRLHPILNLIRGHMGTDYAAPLGTPVHAAADGRVSFEGVRGGYGNAILLTHSNGISTLYGHLSRFARGLRAGLHVGQGQVIGYVGMTGLATGPHLHYEYLVNGVHKDPQTVKLPRAEPLSADKLVEFQLAAAAPLADLASGVAPGLERIALASTPAPGGEPITARAAHAAPQIPAHARRPAPTPELPPGFSLAGMAQFPGESHGAVD